MAEIGLIASVIQVAGAGLTLSKTLYHYADSVSSADKRIRDIAQDVKLTSFVIDELGRIFKQGETAALISKNAVNTAEETVRECSNVFTEMEAALKKSKKNTLGRLMLPFREPKLELLRTNIDRLKSTLQLLMQVLTHAHQIAAQHPDKKRAAAQRQQIKALIQTKKESTKRYEESLRNYSMSEGSTVTNDDDNLGANINDEKHETTDRSINMFSTASSIGSTITAKGLESCVEHIQKLLKDIEAVQHVLNANIDGTSSTNYEQGLIGAYFRTRSALDSVILGSSSTAKVDSGLGEVMSPKNEQLSLVSMEGGQEEKIRLEVALRKTTIAAEGPGMDALVNFDPLVSHSPSPQNCFAPRHPSSFKQQTGLPPVIAPGLSPSEILERAEEDDRARRAAQDANDLLESKRRAEEESAKFKCPTEEKLRIITFKDAIGRRFSFPFHMCKTWKGMEELINQAFLHVDVVGLHVREGRYDLVGPDDEVIPPQLWETVVQPDWVVTMHMWPTPEPPKEQYLPPPPMLDPHMVIIPPPPGAVKISKEAKKAKKAKKSAAHHGPLPMSMGAPLPSPPPPSPLMDMIEVPPPPPMLDPHMVIIPPPPGAVKIRKKGKKGKKSAAHHGPYPMSMGAPLPSPPPPSPLMDVIEVPPPSPHARHGMEMTKARPQEEMTRAGLVTEEKLLDRAMEERASKDSEKEIATAKARAEEERPRAKTEEMARARARASGDWEDSEEEMELSKERERESIKTAENMRTRAGEEWTVKDRERVREIEMARERDMVREMEGARAKAMEWKIAKPATIAEEKRTRAKSEGEWTKKDSERGRERELAMARAKEEEVRAEKRATVEERAMAEKAMAEARAMAEETQMARARAEEEMAKAMAEEMARKARGEWMRKESERGSNSDKNDDVDELLHEWTTLYTV